MKFRAQRGEFPLILVKFRQFCLETVNGGAINNLLRKFIPIYNCSRALDAPPPLSHATVDDTMIALIHFGSARIQSPVLAGKRRSHDCDIFRMNLGLL